MLSTRLKDQNIIRLDQTPSGIEVTAQKHNEYFQDADPRPLLRIVETDKGYAVELLSDKVTVRPATASVEAAA